ncbi:MAG: hypothetical protein WCJ59_02175, partial [bacterium]
MFRKIVNFFDKFEDHVRGRISKRPILFAFVGGFAVVEFWRGVWHLTDFVLDKCGYTIESWESSVISIVVGSFIMLATGLYISIFVGDSVIISGIKREKKYFEKTEADFKEEEKEITSIEIRLDRM